eukprot:3079060-Amphidinium_carterae.1
MAYVCVNVVEHARVELPARCVALLACTQSAKSRRASDMRGSPLLTGYPSSYSSGPPGTLQPRAGSPFDRQPSIATVVPSQPFAATVISKKRPQP